jgi:regulator of protease activity HflC (stomatin/prohibitin superfamily)
MLIPSPPLYKIKYIFIGILALIPFIIFWGCFYTVNSGQRALVLRFGQVQEVVSDGLHLKLPFIEKVILVDVRTQKSRAPASAGTKDLQTVTTEVALNYHLNANTLQDTYARIGLDVEDKVIEPRIQEIVKAVIARFSAEELLTRRDAVKQEIAYQCRRHSNYQFQFFQSV